MSDRTSPTDAHAPVDDPLPRLNGTRTPLWGAATGALGIVVLAVSFLGVYRYRIEDPTVAALCKHLSALPPATRRDYAVACTGIANNAWRGVFGWLGVVLATAASLVVLVATVRRTTLTEEAARSLSVPLFGLGTLSLLAGTLVVPSGSYKGRTLDSFSSSISASHGWPYWAMLIAATAGTFCASQHLRTTRQRGATSADVPGAVRRREPFV